MNDQPPGPGWWRANDGNWYPPESHPDAPKPNLPALQPPPPAAQGQYIPPGGGPQFGQPGFGQQPPGAYGQPGGGPFGTGPGGPAFPPQMPYGGPVPYALSAPSRRRSSGGCIPVLVAVVFLGIAVFIGVGLVNNASETTDFSAIGDDTTEVPTPEQAPSQSEAPAPAPPPPPPPTTAPPPGPLTRSGSGDFVWVLPRPMRQLEILTASHNGESNFAVELKSSDGQMADILVNTIGNYRGTTLFTEDVSVSAIEVTADGPWSLEIKSYLQARPWDGRGPLNEQGDSVFTIAAGTDSYRPAAVGHSGESNFALWAFGTIENDLLVNDIGAYSGTVALPAGTRIVAIEADGPWSIRPG